MQWGVKLRSPAEDGGSFTEIYSSTLEVTEGERNLELDLSEHLLAKCRVEVLVEGEPLAGVFLFLHDKLPEGTVSLPSPPLMESATTGEDGRARLGRLPAKRPVLLTLSRDNWMIVDPGVKAFESGENRDLRIELEFAEHEILAVDESGAPLAETEIVWASERASSSVTRGTTSSDGTLVLRLPVGTYGFFREGPSSYQQTEVEWRSGSAPIRVVVQ